MTIARGIRQPDNRYLYTCLRCSGMGYKRDVLCTDCYDLDYDVLIEHFATARGTRYYALLKAILSLKGQAIADRALEINEGNIRRQDLFHLLVEFNFPRNRFKPLVEWLEECKIIPAGTYDEYEHQMRLNPDFRIHKVLAKLGY